MDRTDGWREVLRGFAAPEFRRWKLSPLQAVDPTRLLWNESDALGRLFLTLAVVFNDLKGLVMFEGYLIDYGTPSPEQPTPELGQWRGLQTQVQRFLAGVLYELMEVLTHSRTKAPLASPELRQVLSLVSEETRERWASLVTDAPQHAPMAQRARSLLYQLRNCSAFHYDQVSLARSYLDGFAKQAHGAANEANRRALFSYGPDMDGTRYYYADLAAQNLFLGLAHGRTETRTDSKIVEIAVQVNEALGPVICAFIQHRNAEVPAS